MEGIQTFKGSWPWPWPWIRPYGVPLCITHRPLPVYQISLKSKKLFVDGRTDVRTDVRTDIFPPSNIIRSTFGSRPNKWIISMPVDRRGHFTKDGDIKGLEERIGIFYVRDHAKNKIPTSRTWKNLRNRKNLGKEPAPEAPAVRCLVDRAELALLITGCGGLRGLSSCKTTPGPGLRPTSGHQHETDINGAMISEQYKPQQLRISSWFHWHPNSLPTTPTLSTTFCVLAYVRGGTEDFDYKRSLEQYVSLFTHTVTRVQCYFSSSSVQYDVRNWLSSFIV